MFYRREVCAKGFLFIVLFVESFISVLFYVLRRFDRGGASRCPVLTFFEIVIQIKISFFNITSIESIFKTMLNTC